MCGLFSGSGLLDPQKLAALGCLNAGRGTDSAGLAWLENESITVKKKAVHPAVAFTGDLLEALYTSAPSGLVIGHTRAATTGTVNDENAHPFLMDGIAFAHNGIITNHATFGTYAVDSQSLIEGIKKKDFSAYIGSIALVWIEDGKLHAFRNGGPLWRGVLGDGLYLASDDDYLKAIGCKKIRELSEHHHYTFDKGKILKAEKIPSRKIDVIPSYQTHWNYNTRQWEGYGGLKPARPDPWILCDCGHNGRHHKHPRRTTGQYGCYAKKQNNNLCPCVEFSAKIEPVPPPDKKKICADPLCKHAGSEHTNYNEVRGTYICMKREEGPKWEMCPCYDFKETLLPEKSPDCLCGHMDITHHTKKGYRGSCCIWACACQAFAPNNGLMTEAEKNLWHFVGD